MIKKTSIFACIMVASMVVFAQDGHLSFHEKSQQINNTGMFVLGGWALANIATGAVGWNKYNGEKRYFNQMNLMWNTVNLSIAGFALYSNFSTDASLLTSSEIFGKHLKTEQVLLINSALDLGYIGTGFLLKHFSSKNITRTDVLKGYGNSLILQGGFLLVFDLALYAILKNHRLTFADGVSLIPSPNITSIHFSFAF